MHSIEILIDRQVKAASQDGLQFPQTLDIRKSIIGFDFLDVINLLGPVQSRIKHFQSWGYGWIDLLLSIGVTMIFGNGFGELIRPNDPATLCGYWQSVRRDMDYLTTSVSTIKMLYETDVTDRAGVGEQDSIVWTSTSRPFEAGTSTSMNEEDECCLPHVVQYLLSKSWKTNIMSRELAPVNLASLKEKGAVVFGHYPFLGRRKQRKEERSADCLQEDQQEGTSQERLSVSGSGSGSGLSSQETQSTRSTAATIATEPSPEVTNNEEESKQKDPLPNKSRDKERKGKRWSVMLHKWTKPR